MLILLSPTNMQTFARRQHSLLNMVTNMFDSVKTVLRDKVRLVSPMCTLCDTNSISSEMPCDMLPERAFPVRSQSVGGGPTTYKWHLFTGWCAMWSTGSLENHFTSGEKLQRWPLSHLQISKFCLERSDLTNAVNWGRGRLFLSVSSRIEKFANTWINYSCRKSPDLQVTSLPPRCFCLIDHLFLHPDKKGKGTVNSTPLYRSLKPTIISKKT